MLGAMGLTPQPPSVSSRADHLGFVPGTVEPQLGNMARVLFGFAALDLLDDVDEALVGAGRDADLLAFAHDKAVQELDLGAPAFGHVLAHRRLLIGRAAPDPRQPPLIMGLERSGIAL